MSNLRFLAWPIAVAFSAVTPAAMSGEIYDDGKVRVQELRYKPGDEGPSIARPFRVIRVLEGGTIRRTFPDGRTDDVEYKTGETKIYPPDPVFKIKNVGKTDIVFFVVAIKDAQK